MMSCDWITIILRNTNCMFQTISTFPAYPKVLEERYGAVDLLVILHSHLDFDCV